MKKLTCIILALMLCLSLAACGESQNTPTGEGGTTEPSSATTAPTEATTSQDIPATGELTEEFLRNYPVAPASDFECEPCEGGIRISSYVGNDDIVVIPETINGQAVVAIAGYLFANESTVRAVYVPSTVTVLSGTFPNNENLEIVICEGVEKILDQAFLNCKILHTVVLGNALAEIGERSFAGCKELKELYIASSLTTIDADFARMVFYKCENLTIHGKAGSYIETFCSAQDIPFVAE